MTTIGRLPKLEVLKLEHDAFVGERWDTRDGEFQQLKFLKLSWLRITEWNVASSEHFPRLQRLVLLHCYGLEEIPCEIGEIATLQLIEVDSGERSVAESATEIQEKRREMGNEEFRVITGSFRGSPCFPDVVYNLGGKNMDSCSRETLFLVYRGMSGWRSDQGNLIGKIPWSKSHVSTVRIYILKLNSIKSDFKLPISAKDLPFSRKIVESIIQELQKFFVVPKLPQLYGEDDPKALKKNELFAAFLNFLLELLHKKIRLVHSFKDQIEDLKKELRFLVTVLGDTLLINDELEIVNNLLAEFEQVANEAGNLVYSFIFAMDGVYLDTRMEDDLNALFDHIHPLKASIIKFSNLVDDHTTRKTVVVHSPFIVDSLLYNLEDLMNKHDDRIVDAKEQIKALHQELMLSKSLLDDIKLQRCIEIEEAMTRIRDVAYEAEYLINSFSVGDAPPWYLTIRLPKVIRKIKLIGTELEEIKEKYYNNRVLEVEEVVNAQPSLPGNMHHEVDGFTVGLEEKAIDVLDQLVGGPQHRQIVIISGMPGLGKTTLAKKLYNHPTVNYYFDRLIWCVVSQTYQRRSLLIGIMISLASEHEKYKILHMTEEELGEKIYKGLKGRRYLIVMDDVWDSKAWDGFRRYFPDDRNESRILLTSRNKDVAPPNSIIYALPSMSNDQCWELLQKKVFHDEQCPPELRGIGEEIAKNCHGLPLAVVVTAGILSTMDKEERTWKNVGQRLASYIFSDKNNSTMQILELSYKHLPKHLKPCFLYLGAFPEDAEIPVKKLKYLWIAEGFIPNYKMLKTAEDVAEQYLMELIGRSLLVVAKRRSDGGAKACVVHDLLHECCLRIAEEENFLKLMEHDCSICTRHPRQNVKAGSFRSFGLHIRSLFGSNLARPLNFVDMRLLKLLVLPRGKLGQGDGSENLVHLRYLVIKYLPTSIGSLGNLEFLTVMEGQYKVSISSVIEKLMKLKYLSVPIAYFDRNCSNYQTNNLEFLSDIYIEKPEDENILKCSPHLRKLKVTLKLDNPWKNHCLDLSFLTQLESLNASRRQAMVEINFPLNIRKLTLYGLQLPSEKMTTIGRLPKLEVLKLEDDAFVGERWDTRDGEFQQLKFLKLSLMTEWNVASSEHFPRLQRLVLWCCDKLKEIPCEIGKIATLQLIEVFCCQNSVAESATKIQEEQWELGNEELRVVIADGYS